MSNQHQNYPEPAEHEIVRQHFPEQPSKETVERFRDKLSEEHAKEEKDPAD
jgi:hypothetical protein